MTGLLMFLVLAVVLGAILTPLLRRASDTLPEAGARADARDGAALLRQKKEILREIKDIEMDYLMGKLSDDDYGTLSTDYKAQAVEVLKKIDAAERKAPPITASAAPESERSVDTALDEPKRSDGPARPQFCSQCGAERLPETRFCASCGEELT